MPAGAQRAPGLGLAGAGAIRRCAAAEEDCKDGDKDGETDAAHRTSLHIRDQAPGADDAEPQQQR